MDFHWGWRCGLCPTSLGKAEKNDKGTVPPVLGGGGGGGSLEMIFGNESKCCN